MSDAAKVAVVTGAGSGIGRAVATTLIRDGYHVVIAGRSQSALEETASAASGPGTATAVVTDVTRPDSVAALFDAVADRFGRLDVLVNNAGIFGPSVPVDQLPLRDWQAVVDTNLTGAFLCAQHAFTLMKGQVPQGGRIINNGSLSAHTPRPNAIAYTATKHAISGLTKALSLEGRKYNIACGQIDVGNAATALTASMATGVLQADGSTVPEPTMDVQHVADAVLHMANLPLDTNIQTMTIMATAMPYIGRG